MRQNADFMRQSINLCVSSQNMRLEKAIMRGKYHKKVDNLERKKNVLP